MDNATTQTKLTIKPNSFYGYHVKYFIFPGLILFFGNIFITIFLPVGGLWTLLPALGLLVMGLIDLYIYETRSISLTDTSIVVKKGSKVTNLKYSDIKEVTFTDNYYFGNNRKRALFIEDALGSARIPVIAMSWNAKDIQALYDTIPVTVTKRILEKAL